VTLRHIYDHRKRTIRVVCGNIRATYGEVPQRNRPVSLAVRRGNRCNYFIHNMASPQAGDSTCSRHVFYDESKTAGGNPHASFWYRSSAKLLPHYRLPLPQGISSLSRHRVPTAFRSEMSNTRLHMKSGNTFC